jgi:hypothetical protein
VGFSVVGFTVLVTKMGSCRAMGNRTRQGAGRCDDPSVPNKGWVMGHTFVANGPKEHL